jgi:DNA-binding response OmpR family regulator
MVNLSIFETHHFLPFFSKIEDSLSQVFAESNIQILPEHSLEQCTQKIILIEGKQTNHPSFFLSLKKKGYNVAIASTGNAALEKIKEELPLLVLLDAASLRTAGNRIVYSIKKRFPSLPVIVIIDEFKSIKKSDADRVMVLPFTIQKLVNGIKMYLPVNNETLQAEGNIALDLKNNRIFVNNHPSSVTPRVAKLLNLLMDQPGKTLERKELFTKLWDTNYVEDMRSLDVHIRWLRQVVEEDPKNPKIIQTVRGVGYRFSAIGNHAMHSDSCLDNEVVESINMEK